MESGNRTRSTLFEQMTAVENGRDALVGLTPDAILGNAKQPEQPPAQNRTLLEIIRDDESNKDKKSWKTLRDKLLLKRPISACSSSVHIPASDNGGQSVPVSDPPVMNFRPQLARSGSIRVRRSPVDNNIGLRSNASPSRSFRLEITVGNDADSSEDDDSPVARNETRQLRTALTLERALSARETAAEEPVRISLMDFLEETEQQMGLMGTIDDEEYEEEDMGEASGGMQHMCCVCMVRNKGAAIIPCLIPFVGFVRGSFGFSVGTARSVIA
ncbi:hypothetical protein F3Y22_tig00110462pilonHSYRG00447 [Hibiscus syriacus]|uniref:RING/U-box superfamily protein n=1 Tax=Hibiscus syriacus TaxID=106335 RepID=A0A6A3AHC6_HIBSY|nr:hypothetical protein F3Y22_tig00110462pilonHSYRG00447 [Hibiscus syriacus]